MPSDMLEVNRIHDQVVKAPPNVKLEIAAAMYDDPRPAIRRMTISVVRMALTELEAKEAQGT